MWSLVSMVVVAAAPTCQERVDALETWGLALEREGFGTSVTLVPAERPPGAVKSDTEAAFKVVEWATDAVLVEATVACPEYPNTAAIVFQKMDELGFRLFDITDLNRTPERGVLWLIEAVFVRKDSALATAARTYR